MRSILFPRRKHFHIPDISDKVSSWKMDIIFLKFVCFFFFLNMVSPKEDCKFYLTKHDVFVVIETCDREIFLPKKIHSVKCPKHCENDPKVRIFYVIYSSSVHVINVFVWISDIPWVLNIEYIFFHCMLQWVHIKLKNF